jgi:hypothetical protein
MPGELRLESIILNGMIRQSALTLLLVGHSLAAQTPPTIAEERGEFEQWLATAPNSPLIARAMAPIGTGIKIGPTDADVPYPGVNLRVTETGGVVSVIADGSHRALPRYRLTSVDGVSLYVAGSPGRSVVMVFGGERQAKPPQWFEYNPAAVYVGPLLTVQSRAVRIIALDGLEADATEVGNVVIPDGTQTARLRVYRVPDPGTEESELVVYFQDPTNKTSTYPAGRFVSLEPLPDGRYRLDFNRARNPFCAYSSVYPCPAPWPGNQITAAVTAGERYSGGGLDDHNPKQP